MIDSVFPYVAEEILEKLINLNPSYALDKLGLPRKGFVGVKCQLPIVFPHTEVMFDGASKIDLGLLFEDDTIFPIEVKVGHKGLERATLNSKLKPCIVSSHTTNTRISGNILAVLNRYFDPELEQLVASDSLHARWNGQQFVLRTDWGIIARNKVLASWSSCSPDFNGRQHLLSLESLWSDYGRDPFNKLVQEMLLDHDYFSRWVGRDA